MGGNRTLVYAAALAIATLLALALYGCSTGRWDEANAQPRGSQQNKEVPICMPPDMRERVRNIMFKSLDEALQQQIEHLFITWLKDLNGQPQRAAAGIKQAFYAYRIAYEAAQAWAPPLCDGPSADASR